ncbi:MAG: bifunctional ADP-heptose synthase [Pyrinomonadaceae bacterium]
MQRLSETIANVFQDKEILIVGDLVADQFLRGTIDRVSREAPVFIMRHDETETRAGGAANAAVNVSALGGRAVAVGLVGTDRNGRDLLDVLEDSDVDTRLVVSNNEFQTTTKVRVLAGQHYAQRQQVIRIDYENKQEIDEETALLLNQNAAEAALSCDAIVISDYNYGVANDEIVGICTTIARERNIPILIDSRNRLSRFKNTTSATPNEEEAEQILGAGFSDKDCEKLREKLGLDALLLTRGNRGMLLIERGQPPHTVAAVGSKEPVDVTGAGDTVIAVYALGLASGLSFKDAAEIANHAGGLVVMKQGTASISPEELIGSLKRKNH